jgi:peptidoglycan/xylan/chitin deacetylase (PgdA/CDA1 family)
MHKKFGLWLPVLCLLFFACRSINSSRTELNMPTSIVCLRFDDGPNARGDTTRRLLDVLKKYQIQAQFCLLGENAAHNPDLVRRIYDEGHCIINHGYSDKWAYRMNDKEFRNNLLMGEAAISAALGHNLYPKLYRPHGGFYRKRQEKILRDEGYTIVPVTVRVYDAVITAGGKDKAVRQVTGKVIKQGGGIILLHDARDSYSVTEKELARNNRGVFDRSWIPEAVEEIIITLLDKGFTFKAEIPLFCQFIPGS